MRSALVLAAGRSRRMGTQKLLLPLGATTVIGHIVDQLLRSVIEHVHVVVGCQADRITEALSGRSVSLVTNPDYRSGMLSSVRCGLQALPPSCETVLLALGDQPSITTDLIHALAAAYDTTDRRILVPLHQGKRGHPLLFAMDYREEILARYDDVGLRGLLRAHPDDVYELSVADSAVLADIDYPADYQQQLAALQRNAARKTS